MSEDFAAGLIPLEDAGGEAMSLPADMVMPTKDAAPAPAPVTADPAPVAEPEPVAADPAAPAGDDEADGLEAAEQTLTAAVQGDPQKAGILADLKATRGLVKQLKQQNKAGREIAQKLLSRPDLVHLLETNQPIPSATIQELRQPGPVTPVAPVTPVDSAQDIADLELIAQTNGLYKQDGSGALDVDAAKRVRDFVKRTADAAVEQRMKPVEQRLLQADASVAMTEALNAADQLGIDREVSTPALASLMKENPEYLRDPQTVSAALFAAAGIDAIQKRRNAPAPAPPVRELVSPVVQPIVREQSTVAATPKLEITGGLRSVQKSHGLSAKSIEGTMSRLATHDPKTNFVLEDE